MNKSDYFSKNQKHKAQSVIAYFSMEVGIDLSLPTYNGGLGILAGDTLRAADLVVGIYPQLYPAS